MVKKMYMHATTAQQKEKPSHLRQSTKSARKTIPTTLETMRTTSLHLTGKEPGQNRTPWEYNHGEVTIPHKEDTNQDQDPDKGESLVETTAIELANSATSARSKDTNRKNAGRE